MTSNELRLVSIQFARDNLKECAQEVIEWHDTAILRDGKVRELAKMCNEWASGVDDLRLAERIVERVALEEVAK